MSDIYYKVVRQINNKLVSCAATSFGYVHKLTYTPGMWDYPQVGKIFVFGSLEAAKKFECECLNPVLFNGTHIPSLYSSDEVLREFWNMDFTNMVDFWEGTEQPWTVPTDTYVCDAVKLIKEVK
jgi:hypothetical protein